MAPLSPVGWGAPVELIESGISLTLLPLSTVAGCGHTCHRCNRQH